MPWTDVSRKVAFFKNARNAGTAWRGSMVPPATSASMGVYTRKFLSLTSTISTPSSRRNMRSNRWAAATPPNPPPTTTMRFMRAAPCLQAHAGLHEPAIDEVGGRRSVASLIGGQPDHEVRDLVRLGDMAQRDGAVKLGLQMWVGERGGIDWRIHRAGADVDDGNAMWCQLHSGCAGQHTHPALGAAVRDVARHRPVLMDR